MSLPSTGRSRPVSASWYFVNEGESISRVAERFGVSRQTVSNHQNRPDGVTDYGKPQPKRGSKLDLYKPYIEARLREFDLTAAKLFEEIKTQGYTGGYTVVKDFVRSIREGQVKQATERFETLPGVQAQVDFGECGVIEVNGERKKLYVFVMVLGFSRMLFARFTTSMNRPTFLTCLREGFERLGIPKELLIDNLKAAVDQHLIGQQVRFNREFMAFCAHYGILPMAAPPYWPRVKGKVERGVGYIKGSFLSGLSFSDLKDLNQQLDAWLDRTANLRVHGTTGEKPIDRYQTELPQLKPTHTVPAFDTRPVEMRQVSLDSFVSYQGVRYSVNPKAAGKTVWLRPAMDDSATFEVYLNDILVARHKVASKGTQSVLLPEHAEAIRQLSRTKGSRTPKPQFRQVSSEPPRRWPSELVVSVQAPSLTTYTPLLDGIPLGEPTQTTLIHNIQEVEAEA